MYIKHLEVENWKCFKNFKSFNFQKHELIKMKNGTGKTSIFEAILYAIWGKAPSGFNLNTIRNDDSIPCRVFISFDIISEGVLKEVSIERVFGGNSLCELKVDGVLVCESVRTIENYMNGIVNQNISEQLWTSSLIDSDIMSSNFFTKYILEDLLKDPLELINIYKSKIYNGNKKINSFNQNILDISNIEKNLEDVKSKLKEKSDGDINLAKSSEQAEKNIKNLQSKIDKNISIEEAREYMKLFPFKIKIQNELEKELKKKESIFSNFNEREINKIIEASLNNKRCILCGGEFNEEHSKILKNELLLTGRSEDKIKKLQNQLNLLKYDENLIKSIIELESQKNILNKCPNYKEIINSYNEENDFLWKEFSRLQKEYALALKQQEELKEINKLKTDVNSFKEKLSVLNEYVQDANLYYTNQIMEKASQYLSSINSRYKQIFLYEKTFHIVVEDSNFALNTLPVARLSSGEKTICSLSLLFSVHNIMVPELPLLFDETFAALDTENLEQIQKFLRKQSSQIFIITHDKNWEEF